MDPLGVEVKQSEYLTVENTSEIENIEKRSRFIGRCFPVSSESEAIALLENIRKEDWDATHHCYAYRLKNGAARYSDDGEPSGTAGMPMMDVLARGNLCGVLVVVTRYFGGILLGTGGLVRAYTKATSDAIRSAGVVRMTPCVCYLVECPYPAWNSMRLLLDQFGRIDETDFAEIVRCNVWIKEEQTHSFFHSVTERFEGRIAPQEQKRAFFPFPVTEVEQ